VRDQFSVRVARTGLRQAPVRFRRHHPRERSITQSALAGIVTLTSVERPDAACRYVVSIRQRVGRMSPDAGRRRLQSELRDKCSRSVSGGVDGSEHG